MRLQICPAALRAEGSARSSAESILTTPALTLIDFDIPVPGGCGGVPLEIALLTALLGIFLWPLLLLGFDIRVR